MSQRNHEDNVNRKQNNRTDRKKKNAQRFKNDFGLDESEFGLNGQDFPKYHHQPLPISPAAATTAPACLQSPLANHNNQQDCLVATQETLEAFSDDVASLWCGFGAIPVLEEPPSALTFLRDFVSPSRPCIIRNALLVRDARTNSSDTTRLQSKGAANHLSLSLLRAVEPPPQQHHSTNSNHDNNNNNNNNNIRPLHLSLDDIVDMDPNLEIVVDATPDGHGDCVRTVVDHSTGTHSRLFVTPEQRRLTLAEFRTQLRQGRRRQRRVQKNTGRADSNVNAANNMKGCREYESDANPYYESSDESNHHEDLALEEEVFDKMDGKRIFGLKNSRKTPKKDKNLMEDVFATCTPTAGTGGSHDDVTFGALSCNPLNDMGELFLQLVEEKVDQFGKNPKNDTVSKPAPPPPPPPPPSVLYYSRQNDCFRTELPSLYAATRHVIPESFDFAEQAFGTGKPEAVNLWAGDERAVSSMHKDPYENLFYVASGEKIFTLCPPADAPYLYEQDFLSGSFDSQPPRSKQTSFKVPPKRTWSVKTGFENNDDRSCDSDSSDDDIRLNRNDRQYRQEHSSKDGLTVDIEPIRPQPTLPGEVRPAYVRWIEADVSALTDPHYGRQQLRKFPMLKYAHPIHQVRVQAGELLYLPALWFHRVTQSRETIGLNYWYNMNFSSPHWCYFQLLNQVQLKPALPQIAAVNRHSARGNDDDAEKKNGF